MLVTLSYNGRNYRCELRNAIDLSIPLRPGNQNVNAFYIPPMVIEPFRSGSFVGDIKQGGSCNVFDIRFNPHGNGTHTETVGHISPDAYPIRQQLKEFFFVSLLISVRPEKKEKDQVITAALLEKQVGKEWPEALVIRTLPNADEKNNRQYSGTNPVYLSEDAALLIRHKNVKHLLVDFPSVDREEDGGMLLAHKAFWNYPGSPRSECTITELIYADDSVADGWYLLNLQTASFENDASPSKPVLFPLEEMV